ncbi:MAG: ABC-2 transporter permease [Clostridia bacterium]|nr:ABC-2 transporter permease [Clostridia bacterium]
MTSFKKYFTYHFKSTLLRGAVMAVLALALTVTSVYPDTVRSDTEVYIRSDISFLGILAAILCTVIPILELSGFKNRRNLDTLFFLPVTRQKMAVAHYINGLIHITVISAICFVTAALRLIGYAEHLNLLAMFPFFGYTIFACIVMYSVFMFVFTQANTVADGAVFMAIYAIAGFCIVTAIGEITSITFIEGSAENYFVYSPISVFTSEYNGYITPTIKYFYYDPDVQNIAIVSPQSLGFNDYEAVSFVFWGIAGIASVLGYLFTFSRQKAEKAGGISDSPFGYKVLIPLCGLCIYISIGTADIMNIMYLIAMAIGYIIYRRSFKLKIPDLVVLGAFLAFILCGFIF